jgi:hypothetical protein
MTADRNQNSREQTQTTEERFAVDVARRLGSEEMLTGGRALSELIIEIFFAQVLL